MIYAESKKRTEGLTYQLLPVLLVHTGRWEGTREEGRGQESQETVAGVQGNVWMIAERTVTK